MDADDPAEVGQDDRNDACNVEQILDSKELQISSC